jgi:uncharacterized protein with PIN domain
MEAKKCPKCNGKLEPISKAFYCFKCDEFYTVGELFVTVSVTKRHRKLKDLARWGFFDKCLLSTQKKTL